MSDLGQKSPLIANRSMPEAMVIPVLRYPDVAAAIGWLRRAFGFAVRLRAGSHRVQLDVGQGRGSVIVAQGPVGVEQQLCCSVMIRVADVDALCDRALACGARVLIGSADYPFGERQCSLLDPAGHAWTFSQTLRDADPSDWGGVLFDPATNVPT